MDVDDESGISAAHWKEVAMALMRRERFDFPEWFRFEIPDVFRRMADLDPHTGWLRVEEYVDGDTLVVRAELPDIDPDKDVELSVANGVLHIRAQREEKTEKREKDVYRSEFRYGSFVRNVPLPEGVKEDDITASYKDGILEIRAPIAAEEQKPPLTKVPISRE
jgi:HSP20 family protein